VDSGPGTVMDSRKRPQPHSVVEIMQPMTNRKRCLTQTLMDVLIGLRLPFEGDVPSLSNVRHVMLTS